MTTQRDYHYLFYAPSAQGDVLCLDEDESRHANSVLRLKPGDALTATDGRGTIFSCTVETIATGRCIVRVVSRRTVPPLWPQVRLCIGIPERDAFERMLDGCVPLGVARISPVVCRFCQKNWWSGKWEKLVARFEKKCIAGMKLACHPYLPSIDKVASFDACLASIEGIPLLADPEGVTMSSLFAGAQTGGNVVGLIGPPGGFAPEELDRLQRMDVKRVTLSQTRLSTDLAAIAFAAGVAQISGRPPAF
jgi:16S rRNA (uracil1498-N3)-methyltransferase